MDVVNGHRDHIDPMLLWLAGVFIVFGAVSTTYGVRKERALRRVASAGRTADATVTSVKPARLPLFVDDPPRWVVLYSYQDDRGRVYHGKSGELTAEEGARWKPGDRGVVRFDSSRADKSVWMNDPIGTRTDPESRRRSAQIGEPLTWFALAKRAPTLWTGPFMSVVGLFIFASQFDTGGAREIAEGAATFVLLSLPFLAAIRRVWIWHRLARDGDAAVGAVTAVEFALFGADWVGRGITEWQRYIRFQYADAAGDEHRSWSGYLSAAQASRWRVGDPCLVRFDRRHPQRSVWIGAHPTERPASAGASSRSA